MDATVLDDGTVLFEIPQVMLNCVGEVACYVMITDAEGNYITSSDFYLDVKQVYYTGEGLSDDPEYSLLVSLFNRLCEFTYEEEQREAAEQNRILAENNRMAAEIIRDEKVKQVQGLSGAVILPADGWSGDNTQNITVLEADDHDLIIFYPETISDRYQITHYGIFMQPDVCDNVVGCMAKGRPPVDISLRYFILRGRDSD
jgi:hypothetical protein